MCKHPHNPRTTKVQEKRIQKNQVFEVSSVYYCETNPDADPQKSSGLDTPPVPNLALPKK